MSKSSKKVLHQRELYAALALALPLSSMAAAGGNVPVVQIAAPNAAGVSHNQFNQFDVGAQGMVLNNSGTAVASQLAGQIAGNGNLANGAAKLIINEVTGGAPSQLNGALEIAGQKAALIVANPNGINADGASFINASRVTLATGTPQFDASGAVSALSVAKGVINVTGKGIDASGVEMADLMARSVVLNAELKAQQLRVVTGANQIAYASNGNSVVTKAIAGEGAAPKLALDVSNLGGMYANAIRMVGTEKGVGVNVAGTIKGADSVSVASGDMVNIVKGGTIQSGGGVSIDAGTHVFNAGSISADSGNIALASLQPGYSATFDGQGGTTSAAKGTVTLTNFGNKRTGQVIAANGGLATDDNGNMIGSGSSVSDGNGTFATRPPVTPAVEPPVDKPVEPPVDKPVDKPVEPPVDKPVDKPVEPPVDKPVDKPVEPPVDKPVDKPIEPPVDKPVDKPIEPPVDKPVDKPIEPPVDKPVDKPVEPPVDKPVDKPIEPPVDKPVDKPVEPPVNKPVDKPAQPPIDKPVDKPAQPPIDKPVDKPAQPPVDKPVDKPAQPPVDKPVDKPVEQPKPATDPVPSYDLGQLLDALFNYPSYGFAPWSLGSYGYSPWYRPSYGYVGWNAPSYGFAPWMPSFFRPQPVFSPYRPMASYGVRGPRWR
ncbi:filamentous hemagglutinin N-terminal domain-containing protein [Dyella sp. LX-66]|uniref:two-partner secretion domain-containing protein n=1 Tax=unclassified Dyella TaxID=2634549 RepID=UPI001BE05087|nr:MULTISPECIES: filamentous hemagglutinin N-terminal domain-containing protein [unclassified Dyella]MBT2116013.1 filamentous hemagglutinin N-terminal domain-containing protein [Dyella sp. LX-1]MBT2138023.1 filamentous hemagglutinin N-terminal domain-containing protein [Dyella sp. LX-66]